MQGFHPVDPMRVYTPDAYGRTPLECSEAIGPYLERLEDQPLAH